MLTASPGSLSLQFHLGQSSLCLHHRLPGLWLHLVELCLSPPAPCPIITAAPLWPPGPLVLPSLSVIWTLPGFPPLSASSQSVSITSVTSTLAPPSITYIFVLCTLRVLLMYLLSVMITKKCSSTSCYGYLTRWKLFLLLCLCIHVWLSTHSTNYLCGFQFLRAWATWGLLMPFWHVTIPAVPFRALMPPVRWWTTLWRGVDARQTLTWAINWPAVRAHCAAVTTQEASHLQVQ